MKQLKQIVNRLTKKTAIPTTKHESVFAFTCGGTDYYQFAEFDNIPALRGLKTVVFYEEVKMKCTIEYLKMHTDAMENILSQTTINVFKIKTLNDQLRQRLDLAIDTELLYKIGSIVYFDAKENLQDYDFAYNARKIESWRKYGGADFFLQKPWQELMPVLKHIDKSLEMYSRTVEKLNGLHLESLLQNLPEDKRRTYAGKSYFSSLVMPQS